MDSRGCTLLRYNLLLCFRKCPSCLTCQDKISIEFCIEAPAEECVMSASFLDTKMVTGNVVGGQCSPRRRLVMVDTD